MPRYLLRVLLLQILTLPLLAPTQAEGDQRDLHRPGASAPYLAGKRVALVVGNGTYEKAGRLAQAPLDAKKMATALRADGFDVVERYNLTLVQMSRTIADFEGALSGADVGFFYYAGHAVQVSDQNYLVPVDSDIEAERYVKAGAVDVMSVLQAMDRAESALNLVVLDSCRNNPFASRWFSDKKSAPSRGLASMAAPSGFMVAYATGPGDVAADNGVYADALSRNLTASGREIGEVFGFVHEEVKSKSSSGQIPWVQEARGPARFYPAGAPDDKDCGKLMNEAKERLTAQASAEWSYVAPAAGAKDEATAARVQKWYGKWGEGRMKASACGVEETVIAVEEAEAKPWIREWERGEASKKVAANKGTRVEAVPVAAPKPEPVSVARRPEPQVLAIPDRPRSSSKPLRVGGLAAAGLGVVSTGLALYFKSSYDGASTKAAADWYDTANKTSGVVGLGLLGAGGLMVGLSFGGE